MDKLEGTKLTSPLHRLIVLLKYQGYTLREISALTHLPYRTMKRIWASIKEAYAQ